MLTSPFFRRLFFPYLLLICAAIGAVGLAGALRLRSSHNQNAQQLLQDDAQLIGRLTQANLRPDRNDALMVQVRDLGEAVGQRITIVAADGTVIADNKANPATMENHRLRPEILSAVSLGEGTSIRPSETIHEEMMYLAHRVEGADGRQYYIRLAMHLRELDENLRALYASIALAALLAMVGAALLSYYLARRHARPLVELTDFADALRHGDLGRRLLQESGDEVGAVAAAMNSMADSLAQLLDSSSKDQAQLRGILSSMSEGVIATDASGRVLLTNAAAATLLEICGDPAPGRFLWEITRHEPVLQGAKDVLASRQRRTIQVGPIAGRHLHVSFATLNSAQDISNSPGGLVIVLHDATESVRFQELRKEFVANVSHELRTPLTVIKGFAETLREGAMNEPARAAQYLATIEKHADQLTNLVNDLLELSKLDSQPGLPRVGPVDVGQIVRRAADLLRLPAEQKGQRLEIKIAPSLPSVAGNSDYLERAVSNLLDNAVKYTARGGTITVMATSEPSRIVIEVTDDGIGIPAEDLPRVFERFYRVDRSRSREMGGTGLGLSIVKHIAQAHRGSVEVTSTPGKGSSFKVILPLPVVA